MHRFLGLSCAGVGLTVVLRRPMQFIKYMYGSSGASSKTFGDIMDEHVTDSNVRQLITMITEGTTSAAPAEIDATYMLRAFHEMWSQNTVLQYPAVRCSLNDCCFPSAIAAFSYLRDEAVAC
jgi:hypothetical protein